MTTSIQAALLLYNQTLTDAILVQEAFKATKASGALEAFIQSPESIAELSDTKFVKIGTRYTSAIDVGSAKATVKSGGLITALYEWLQYKKYGLTYKNDKQRLGIAIGIAKNMFKDGSYKRRNPDERTNIFGKAIDASNDTLLTLMADAYSVDVVSEVNDIVDKINKDNVA